MMSPRGRPVAGEGLEAMKQGSTGEALSRLVAEADVGGRILKGPMGAIVVALALAWALFQLWYASPLPFAFAWGVINDTQARALHLGAALALAFLVFPMSRRSPRDRVPVHDAFLAVAGAFAGTYLFFFYSQIASRPGQPTFFDVAIAIAGIALLLEADAPGGRVADGDSRRRFPRLRLRGSPDARGHLAQGRLAQPRREPHVAHHRRRVRRGTRRLGELHLRLRSFRHAPRPGGRGKLHDAGELRVAGAPARGAGQGRRRVIRPERTHLGLLGEQRGLRGHLHHSAHEEGGLRGREGRRHRDHELGERPDHAAGDGGGGVPHGRVRRHPVQRHRDPCLPAGHHFLHRALLHRAPRGAQAGDAADGLGAAPHDRPDRACLGARRKRHGDGLRRHLLRRRRREGGPRRGGTLCSRRAAPGPLLRVRVARRARARPARGYRRRAPRASRGVADRPGGPALPRFRLACSSGA